MPFLTICWSLETIIWIATEPLSFPGEILRALPVFTSIKNIVYLNLLGIVQHPRWEVLDIVCLSLGGIYGILVVPV